MGEAPLSEKFLTKLSSDRQSILIGTFKRFPANPFSRLKIGRMPQTRCFNPAATMYKGKVLLCGAGRRPERILSFHKSSRARTDSTIRKIDTKPTLRAESGELSGRDMGNRGSEDHLGRRAEKICNRLHVFFERRPSGFLGFD